jgi:hypothetical protein
MRSQTEQEIGIMKLLKSLLFVALCSLWSGVASAAIYKTIDEHGNVVFSDEPSSGAEPVDLPPLPTYTAPRFRSAPPGNTDTSGPGASGYSRLEIQQPGPDATVRDNTGAVAVTAAIEPKLNRAAGHRLQFFLDGQPIGNAGTSASTTFSDVDRGAHEVAVAVQDAGGKELKRSASVTFYLHRQSVNFPTGPASPTPLPTP